MTNLCMVRHIQLNIIVLIMLCLVQFILRKDCKSRTTFNKLKTLLLNEWCMAVDFGALVYFLQCAPVLEKLTLTSTELPFRPGCQRAFIPIFQSGLSIRDKCALSICPGSSRPGTNDIFAK